MRDVFLSSYRGAHTLSFFFGGSRLAPFFFLGLLGDLLLFRARAPSSVFLSSVVIFLAITGLQPRDFFKFFFLSRRASSVSLPFLAMRKSAKLGSLMSRLSPFSCPTFSLGRILPSFLN